MIRYNKPVFCFPALLLIALSANGQQQIRVDEDIAKKFKKYCEAVPREEIYIHTDRDNYIAGEEIWFNAFLTDRADSMPADGSRIVYVELLNPDNRPIVQKRIEVEKGSGPGMVIIPDTSGTGEYTLRAYTNWMKNFLPENCFIKELKIYNVLNSGNHTVTGNKISERSEISNSGHVKPAGFEASINRPESDVLEIMVITNKNFRSENGNLCYIFIRTRGAIDLNKSEYLPGDTTVISVPAKSLTPGINHITFFNSNAEPLYERFIYTPLDHSRQLTVNSPGTVGKRDKILIEIETDKKYFSLSDSMNLSISVAPQTNRQNVPDITGYMIFGSEFGILPEEIRHNGLDELSPEMIDQYLQSVKSNWIDWSVILSGELPDLKYKMENENHFISGNLISRDSGNPDSARYIFLSVPGKTAGFQYSRTDKEGNFSFSIPISQTIKDIIIQPEEVDRNNMIRIESPFSEQYLPMVKQSGIVNREINPEISKSGVNWQVRKIYGISSAGDTSYQTRPVPELKRFYGKPDIELIMDDYIKLPVMEEVFFELIPGVFLKNRKSKYEFSIADPVENKVYHIPPVLFIDGVVVDDPAVIANLDPELVEKIDAVKERYIIGNFLFYGLVNVITRTGDYSCVNLPDYAVRMPYRVIDQAYSFMSPDYSGQEMKLSRIPDFRNTLYWNPSVRSGDDGKIRIEFWASDYASDYEINIQGLTRRGEAISCSGSIRIE